MKLIDESHVDHVSNAVIEFVMDHFGNREEFFVATVDLPAELGTLESGLYGPTAGDPPVLEDEVFYKKRGGREWESRLVDRPLRQTNQITIVGGPAGEDPCVLYTVHGGPPAMKEVGDKHTSPETLIMSQTFWSMHALAAPAKEG